MRRLRSYAVEGSLAADVGGAAQVDASTHVGAAAQLAASATREQEDEGGLDRDAAIGAANNYRLALDTSDDPFIRQKLEDIDELAKTRRREMSLNRARAAERDKRWTDAALHYGKANDARPAAPLAERAAHALWMSNGDLDAATVLDRSAISMDRNNAGYRVTLAEIHVANDAFAEAAEELEEALALDGGHKRARELASIVRKKQR